MQTEQKHVKRKSHLGSLISLRQYIARTGYSIGRLYTLVDQGKLIGFECEGRILIDEKHAMERYINLSPANRAKIGGGKSSILVNQQGKLYSNN